MRRLASLITVMVLTLPTLAPVPAVATELADVRRALGFDTLTPDKGVEIRGRSRYMGTDGTFATNFSAEGRGAKAIAGRVGRTVAFDGTTIWEIDFNGIPRDLVLGERDEELLALWLETGLWTLAPAGLTVEREGNDAFRFALYLTESGIHAVVTVDSATSLPRSFTYTRGSIEVTTTLSDYHENDHIRIAHQIDRVQSDGDEVSYAAEKVSVVSAPKPPVHPQAAAQAAVFDTALPSELSLTVAATEHLLTEVDINGTPAGWFIFDSGAGAVVISTPVARDLGLPEVGTTPVMGIGGTVEGKLFQATSLRVGAMSIGKTIMVGFDLSPYEPAFNVKLGGIIGYDIFAHSIVVYDFNGPHISLHDPTTFQLQGGEWQDLLLYDRTSHVEMSFEGHHGVFLMDTGAANSSVAISAPTVASLDLLANRTTSASQIIGGGGAVNTRAATLKWIELAGHRYEDVPANFATEMTGVLSDAYVAGSVGGKILSRFTLVFDYSHQRIAFVPREAAAN